MSDSIIRFPAVKSMTVRLNQREMRWGESVGRDRDSESRQAGYLRGRGVDEKDHATALADNILGARGELAVAKRLNLYWTGAMKFGAPDVGGYIDVRATTRHGNRLIVYKQDIQKVPRRPFVLAISTPVDPTLFRLAGWLCPIEADDPRYWDEQRKNGGAFFVRQDHLHDMESIPLPPFGEIPE